MFICHRQKQSSFENVKNLNLSSLSINGPTVEPSTKINDSATTIFSSATTMIGCGIIVFPLLFSQYGLLTSMIVVITIGLISFKTASLLLIHTKSQENDLTDVIIRVLGSKYHKLFLLAAGTTLFLVSIIYYLFLNNMLYSILNFISLHAFDNQLLNKEQTSYTQFSFQYCCLICCLFNFIMVSLNDLKIVMKLSKYSFLGIFLFITFITYQASQNISHLNTRNYFSTQSLEMKPLNIEYFTSDISKLVGNCATSFMLHNLVVAIYKQNKVQENNQRDLLISFIITIVSYLFIGGMGYLAILQKTSYVSRPNTVMDYYSDTSVLGLIINVFIFYNIFTINPLISYYGKMQLLGLYYKSDSIPDHAKLSYNLLYSASCAFLGINNICTIPFYILAPISILALIGSLCGFYMIFFLPIMIHLKCLYQNDCNDCTGNDSVLINCYQQQGLLTNTAPCQVYQKQQMKVMRFVFYGLLLTMGFSFLVVTIAGMF